MWRWFYMFKTFSVYRGVRAKCFFTYIHFKTYTFFALAPGYIHACQTGISVIFTSASNLVLQPTGSNQYRWEFPVHGWLFLQYLSRFSVLRKQSHSWLTKSHLHWLLVKESYITTRILAIFNFWCDNDVVFLQRWKKNYFPRHRYMGVKGIPLHTLQSHIHTNIQIYIYNIYITYIHSTFSMRVNLREK